MKNIKIESIVEDDKIEYSEAPVHGLAGSAQLFSSV